MINDTQCALKHWQSNGNVQYSTLDEGLFGQVTFQCMLRVIICLGRGEVQYQDNIYGGGDWHKGT